MRRNSKLFHWFFDQYIKLYKWYFIFSFLLITFSGIIILSIGYFVRIIIDYMVLNEYFILNITYFLWPICLIVIFGILAFLRVYNLSIGSFKIFNKMREDIYHYILNMPISFIENKRNIDIQNIFSSDITIMYNITMYDFPSFIRQIIIVIGALVMMFYSNIILTLYSICIVPVVFIIVFFLIRKMRFYAKEYFTTCANINSNFDEALSNIKIIKIFQSYKKIHDIFSKKIIISYSKFLIYTFYRALLVSSIIIILFLVIIFIVWKGINLVINADITHGQLLSFISYAILASVSLGDIGGRYARIQQFGLFLEKIYNITLHKDSVVENDTKKSSNILSLSENFTSLEIKGLSLNIEHSVDTKNIRQNILNDINFEIKKGETLAILGHSGAGKSTIFDILLRFIIPNTGNIILNNEYDFKDLYINEIRSLFSWVPQEMYLFSTSILSNICFALENTSREDLLTYISEYKHILDKLFHHNNYLNRNIGEKGNKISQGQKQIISIFRALMRSDSPILLLDEFTSALDVKSEQYIQSILKECTKTKIIIAHRLSTINTADKILILNKGNVVEYGLRKELINNKDSHYNKIINTVDDNFNEIN